jgi:glycerophosphoryl diester phosphodiesterase
MSPGRSTPDLSRKKTVVGHRGASAYAPEHTLAAYELALEQGADAVEQDLHVTKDGVLVCLHDRTLERTTNVRAVFPMRSREVLEDGRLEKHWFVHDFTIAEIRQLDAGSWFGTAFAGSWVPTLEEVVECVGDRASLCIELKDPEIYETFGIDLLSLFASALRRHGPAARSPLTVQCFHEPTLRRAATMFDPQVLLLLIEPEHAHLWSTPERIGTVAEFAGGIGPGKTMVENRPELVAWAHAAGLRVTPWTFRAPASSPFGSVRAEMAYHLSVLDVDAVITDNPDQFPDT